MNWGKGIVLGMSIFVLFILSMCVYMFFLPNDDYDHQYYEKGLTFDHDYNREQQVVKDHAQPTIDIEKGSITFTFPSAIKGNVKFIRPSSDASDAIYALDNKNGGPVQLATSHLAKGKWQLIFEWKSSYREYLYQHEVYIK